MSLRIITIAAIVGVGILAFVAWNTQRIKPQEPAAPPAVEAPEGMLGGTPTPAPGGMPGGAPPAEMGSPPSAEAGVTWDKPGRWLLELGREMRLATYAIPATVNGVDKAECAVYYFGPGQGGGVDANVARWAGEFEGGGSPQRSKLTADGMPVNRVRLTGVYRAHAGMAGGSSGPQRDYTLLGAIVEGPNGPLFVKLVGPARTVEPAEKEFDRMLKSLRKKTRN
jgi:hypothetical protein